MEPMTTVPIWIMNGPRAAIEFAFSQHLPSDSSRNSSQKTGVESISQAGDLFRDRYY
jgi:hypothetical protein